MKTPKPVNHKSASTHITQSDSDDLNKLAEVFHVSRSAIIRACILYSLNYRRQHFIRFLDQNVKVYK